MSFHEIIAFIVTLSVILLFLGLLFGKNIFEKILYVNSIGNHVILFLIIFSLIQNNSFYVDIALIYAISSFITNIALLRKYKIKKIGE